MLSGLGFFLSTSGFDCGFVFFLVLNKFIKQGESYPLCLLPYNSHEIVVVAPKLLPCFKIGKTPGFANMSLLKRLAFANQLNRYIPTSITGCFPGAKAYLL